MGKNIFKLLNSDINFIRKYKPVNTNIFIYFKCLVSPSFICVFLYRISHLLHCFRIPLLPRLFWWINFILFKVDIDQRARLYGSLYLPHPMMIVIGHKVEMYGSAKIMQGVTLGGNLGRKVLVGDNYIEQPLIDSNIFIGINTIIIGPVYLKGKLFIASNSCVTKNVEDVFVYENNKSKNLRNYHLKELLSDG